ncbi:uncharacterized protein TNCV_3027791 [Trichonephila clavipes]|nr:uncharacterized protein TNCV_3027791 [Trichonephila clavipes]
MEGVTVRTDPVSICSRAFGVVDFHSVASEQKKQKFGPANIRIALARQLIDRYSSRKRKGHPASFQVKKRAVPDDVRLASVRNHMPKMLSNYRRCRKCNRKGQEKRTH